MDDYYLIMNPKKYNNITNLLEKNAFDKEYVAYIHSVHDKIQVDVFGRQSKAKKYTVTFKNVKAFIDCIPKMFDSKIKAIILQVYGFQSKEFPDNIEFCKDLKEKLDKLQHFYSKTPYYFIPDICFSLTKALIAANVDINFSEHVLVVSVNDHQMIEIALLKYTFSGFRLCYFTTSDDTDNYDDINKLLDSAITKSTPKKVVLVAKDFNADFVNAVKDCLISKEMSVIDISDNDEDDGKVRNVIYEISEWILDDRITKLHVCLLTARIYGLIYECGEKEFAYFWTKPNQSLPDFKTVKIHKSAYRHFIGYLDTVTKKFVKHQRIKFDEKAHEYLMTLKIDTKNIITYKIQNVVIDRIIHFPEICNDKKINGTFDEDLQNAPIIGFFDNRSFICVRKNDKGKYKWMKNWNREWGQPIHIGFANETPEFGLKAEATQAKRGKFVISELFKIIPLSFEEMKKLKPPGFTIEIDANNQTVFEFDVHDESKKAAEPAFLLAMVIKYQIKEIEKEVGKKPCALRICLLNEWNSDGKKNVENVVKEAFKLLKFEKWDFINWI